MTIKSDNIKKLIKPYPHKRVLSEQTNVNGHCPNCHSSQYRKYYFKKNFPFFYTKIYCLNDECKNSENFS